MTVSILLRLAERRLLDGELAGEVEVVDTGQRRLVSTTEELVEFLRGCGAAADDGPEAAPL